MSTCSSRSDGAALSEVIEPPSLQNKCLRCHFPYPAPMRFIVTLFIALIVLSALQPWLQKLGIGRMPGDFRFRIGKREFLLPFTSTLVLTVLMFLIARLI